MALVPLLIAFAVAGGHVTFGGAVATPTAATVSVVTQPSRSTAPAAAQIGRFDDPPRVVSIQPLDSAESRSEIVVKYL